MSYLFVCVSVTPFIKAPSPALILAQGNFKPLSELLFCCVYTCVLDCLTYDTYHSCVHHQIVSTLYHKCNHDVCFKDEFLNNNISYKKACLSHACIVLHWNSFFHCVCVSSLGYLDIKKPSRIGNFTIFVNTENKRYAFFMFFQMTTSSTPETESSYAMDVVCTACVCVWVCALLNAVSAPRPAVLSSSSRPPPSLRLFTPAPCNLSLTHTHTFFSLYQEQC